MSKTPEQIAASVRARLRNKSRETNRDFQIILIHYGIERLIYRLSISDYKEKFVLKGAMLFTVWGMPETRTTKDVDFLAFIKPDIKLIRDIFIELCSMEIEDDAMQFHSDTVSVSEIREDNEYGGIRVKLRATLGNARVDLQVDIGIGDAITPSAVSIDYPTLIKDLPTPTLNAYPVATVIAEKTETIVKRELLNSRLKDYYDIWIISRQQEFDEADVIEAIRATFERRGTLVPDGRPVGLTDQYSRSEDRSQQWNLFVRRSIPRHQGLELRTVVDDVAEFLFPLLEKAKVQQ